MNTGILQQLEIYSYIYEELYEYIFCRANQLTALYAKGVLITEVLI